VARRLPAVAVAVCAGTGLAPPPACGTPDAPPRATVAGRLDAHPALAGAGVEPRTIWVLVPADYDSTRRYPVLYLQDGQDLFDESRAAGGAEWGVDELLQARPQGIPPLFVVGIEATPHARRDYAPPGSLAGARGDAYVRFVVDVVKPYVDARYATRAEPEWTWIGGAGAGGLVAAYAAWTTPHVFGAAIALAMPDLDGRDLAWVHAARPAAPVRLWLEQQGAGALTRGSTTQLLTDLRRGARVDLRVSGAETPMLVRLAAALRALAQP
jgi:hypothetical protein